MITFSNVTKTYPDGTVAVDIARGHGFHRFPDVEDGRL